MWRGRERRGGELGWRRRREAKEAAASMEGTGNLIMFLTERSDQGRSWTAAAAAGGEPGRFNVPALGSSPLLIDRGGCQCQGAAARWEGKARLTKTDPVWEGAQSTGGENTVREVGGRLRNQESWRRLHWEWGAGWHQGGEAQWEGGGRRIAAAGQRSRDGSVSKGERGIKRERRGGSSSKMKGREERQHCWEQRWGIQTRIKGKQVWNWTRTNKFLWKKGSARTSKGGCIRSTRILWKSVNISCWRWRSNGRLWSVWDRSTRTTSCGRMQICRGSWNTGSPAWRTTWRSWRPSCRPRWRRGSCWRKRGCVRIRIREKRKALEVFHPTVWLHQENFTENISALNCPLLIMFLSPCCKLINAWRGENRAEKSPIRISKVWYLKYFWDSFINYPGSKIQIVFLVLLHMEGSQNRCQGHSSTWSWRNWFYYSRLKSMSQKKTVLKNISTHNIQLCETQI